MRDLRSSPSSEGALFPCGPAGETGGTRDDWGDMVKWAEGKEKRLRGPSWGYIGPGYRARQCDVGE